MKRGAFVANSRPLSALPVVGNALRSRKVSAGQHSVAVLWRSTLIRTLVCGELRLLLSDLPVTSILASWRAAGQGNLQ